MARPPILYSCYSEKSSEGEQFIKDHVFSYTFAGSNAMHIGNKSYLFEEGGFQFLRRNQLCRYTKYPPPGKEYRSISITLDQPALHYMSEQLNLQAVHPYTGEGALHLPSNPLFRNYINSLTPYLNRPEDIKNQILTTIKVREAIMILLETHPSLQDVLFDFSEPGKIE